MATIKTRRAAIQAARALHDRGTVRGIRSFDDALNAFRGRHRMKMRYMRRPLSSAPKLGRCAPGDALRHLTPRERWQHAHRWERVSAATWPQCLVTYDVAMAELAKQARSMMVADLDARADAAAANFGAWSRADADRLANDMTARTAGWAAPWQVWVRLRAHIGDSAAALSVDADYAESIGASVVRRGKDWKVIGTTRVPDIGYSHSYGETEWRRGRAVGYTRATNTTRVLAAADVRRGILYAAIAARPALGDLRTITLRAPQGYRWDRDQAGVRLVSRTSPDADFHPTAAQIAAARSGECANIVAALIAAMAQRAETAARNSPAAMAALLADGYVCRADSLRAGNCAVGTDAWIGRAGLDPRAHVRADVVERLGAGNARVTSVLQAAAARHARECALGVAMLAEHGYAWAK